MAANQYDTGLERTAANYVPLSPLSFLPKAALHYPRPTTQVSATLSRLRSCSLPRQVSEQIKWGLGPTAPAGPGQSPGLDFFESNLWFPIPRS